MTSLGGRTVTSLGGRPVTGASWPGNAGRGGFTLLEVLIVMTILVVVAALTVPALLEKRDDDDLAVATRRVEALFRMARDSALRMAVPVTVVMDSVSGLVWFDMEVPEGLAVPGDGTAALAGGIGVAGWTAGGQESTPGSSLELPASVRIQAPRARTRFTFLPSGAAFADTLLLQAGNAVRIVTVNPWTGDAVAY